LGLCWFSACLGWRAIREWIRSWPHGPNAIARNRTMALAFGTYMGLIFVAFAIWVAGNKIAAAIRERE